MTRKYLILSATVAAIALTGTIASAHNRGPGGPGGQMNFETLDTNGDGSISKAEIEARASERFKAVDANNDGFVTSEELEANAAENEKKRKGRGAERMMKRMDADNDGKLSMEEMSKRAGAERMFDRLDADNDGAISKEEFAKFEGKRGGHGKRKN